MSLPSIRSARQVDGADLRGLQSLLSEPSPQLLSAALTELSADSAAGAAGLESWILLVTPDSNDQPVGYLLALPGAATHIAELVVDPDHRREGRATALLTEICEPAGQPVTVHVAADNGPARSLYRRLGFVETGRSADQFESSEGLTLRYEPESGVA